MMETIKKVVSGQRSAVGLKKDCGLRTADCGLSTSNPKSKIQNLKSQSGMSLLAVMAVMVLFAIALLAVAPTVQQGVQREKELESIRRGEEVADAIRQYVVFSGGAKLPRSMDDLLEGLPQGTRKRQILRPSAAIDPLSEDGKWRLIKPDSQAFVSFGKRVQIYNNGLLPSNPSPVFDRFSLPLVNIINTKSESDTEEADDAEIDAVTDNTPFIGVASQSRSKSVLAYYGIENHSKWIFTPLFRGTGTVAANGKRGDKDKPPVNPPAAEY
ncbi:MAG: type II secretion system GspH family protein [Acidobacteriota bacterium]|nr:type II secretion system GspH family protein [Acidobacteriota bacterium]